MELKVNAEIQLKPDDVGKIISDYIKKELKFETTEIRFEIDPGYDDRCSYKAPSLKQAVIKVKV